MPSEGVPYPLFSLAALIPWGQPPATPPPASGSLLDNLNLISKVYFPRLIVPLAGTISGLVDMGASLVVFFVALLFAYRMPLRAEFLAAGPDPDQHGVRVGACCWRHSR